jgi:acyl-CoA reductase-like NAD-dependent aldehyde dehydrogenase
LRSSMRRMMGHRRLETRRVPLGNVLIVGTWNYPLGLHLVQILFALAGGNRVVFKPSPLTPRLGAALNNALRNVVSDDFFRVEFWSNDAVCEQILKRQFQAVVFTGGTRGAQALAKVCGEAMIPFLPEASGSEAAVVLPKMSPWSVETLVDHLFWAVFHHSGQTCVSPRFWFIPKMHAEAVWTQVSKLFAVTPQEFLSRLELKTEAAKTEHKAWVDAMVSLPGAQLRRSAERPDFSAVRVGDLSALPKHTDPTFGPAFVVVEYESLDDVVRWIQESPWSLMTTCLGQPTTLEREVLDGLDASIVAWNEAVASVGDCAIPFGGRGQSGYGCTHGVEGLLQMTRPQTWVDVKMWPGLDLIQPRWTRMLGLNRAGEWLQQLDTNPVGLVKKVMSLGSRERKDA